MRDTTACEERAIEPAIVTAGFLARTCDMTLRPSLLLVLAALAAPLTGCGDDQAPEEAAALLARIRSESYRSWARAPGYETRRKAASPHAEQVDIYVNATVAEALAKGEPLAAWPTGSVIVKDGWDGSDLELIAVMEKRADGWFWAEYFDGDAKYSGRPDVCTECHRSGSDSVRAFALPR